MEEHPEEQVEIQFMVDQTPIVTPLFRELNPEEEASFRQHARETYVVGTEINEINHPVWKDEARIMNDEAYGDR